MSKFTENSNIEKMRQRKKDYYDNIDRVLKHSGKLKEYNAAREKIIWESIPTIGDVYWKRERIRNYEPVFPGYPKYQYVVTGVRNTKGRRGWARLGYNYGHIEVDYVLVRIYFDPDKPIRIREDIGRFTARFDEWEEWREIFNFEGHLQGQSNGQPSRPFVSTADMAMDMVGIDKKKEEEQIKEEYRQEAERVMENIRKHREELDREREEKEAIKKAEEEEAKKKAREAARERERQAEEAARERRELDRRRQRDRERRQHLLRQAELWRRAEAVQRYLPGYWQDATEVQIEEAEREKENEERRVESGGGNPNDSMDMLPIPKLKF